MVAETSINDVLLVVAGGTMGILGTLLTFFFTRSQRSAERIREAYVEYIAATEMALRTFVGLASVVSAENPTGEFVDKQYDWLEKSEEAKTRQAAAYVRAMLCDRSNRRRAMPKKMQGVLRNAYKTVGGKSTDERREVHRNVMDAIRKMLKDLEGQFS